MVLCFLSVGFSGLMLWWRLEKEIVMRCSTNLFFR